MQPQSPPFLDEFNCTEIIDIFHMNCLLKRKNQARRACWLVIHLVGNTDNGNDKIGAATETKLVTGLPDSLSLWLHNSI